MAQGTHRNHRPQLIEDLDALITSRSLKPGKIKLGGRLWTIKRDFTAEQILEFHRLVQTSAGTAEGFKMLFGDKDGPVVAELLLAAPTEIMTPVLRRIYQHAGLLKRVETPDGDDEDADTAGEREDAGEGESSAS